MKYLSTIIDFSKILFSTHKQRERELQKALAVCRAIRESYTLTLKEVLRRREEYYQSTIGTETSLSPQTDRRMDRLIKKYGLG